MGMVYIGDLQGALGGQEIERAYRESLLGGGKRVSDTGASITFGGQRADVTHQEEQNLFKESASQHDSWGPHLLRSGLERRMPEPLGSRPPDPTITMRRGDGAEGKASQESATRPSVPSLSAPVLPAPVPKFYAAARGRRIAIFRLWEETEPLVKGFKGAVHKSFRTLEGAKLWLHKHVQRYQLDLAAAERWETQRQEERTRMDIEESNASIQQSSMAADSLMSTDSPQSPGNTLDEQLQEQRSRAVEKEVSSVAFTSSSPSSAGMEEERGVSARGPWKERLRGASQRREDEAMQEEGPFTRITRASRQVTTPERRPYASTVVSPSIRGEPEWAREIREGVESHEKQEYPAYIPWVHREGRDELRLLGLAPLALSDEDDALEEVMAHFQREYWEVVEECHQAKSQTAQMVLHYRRKSLAQLV